jgi:hypothetical protein
MSWLRLAPRGAAMPMPIRKRIGITEPDDDLATLGH